MIEDSAVEVLVRIGVLRNRLLCCFQVTSETSMRLLQPRNVTRIQKIEATTQPDHGADHAGVPLVPTSSPPPGLLGAILPEVNSVAEPIIIVGAGSKWLSIHEVSA